ncbi:MAG: ArsR/SmtB family transcription factor [Deltaproteobacteria bacterium]
MAKDPLQANHCAEQLKALSEPVRLRIVNALRSGPKNVSELSQSLHVEMVTMSHHLQILRNAGIAKSERKGRFILYSLHGDVFRSSGAREHLDFGCCRLEIPN